MIEINAATDQEHSWGCNVCESTPDPAVVVLLIGRDRASTAIRLCVDHFMELGNEVDSVNIWEVVRAR